MRGTQLQNGEFYTAYYYDIIPAPASDQSGNKIRYTWDTMPQMFKFKESSVGSTTVFASLKGLEKKTANIGSVFQTGDQRWKISTSNTQIDFKTNGKVVIYSGTDTWEFTITKVTNQLTNITSIRAGRFGRLDMSSIPVNIEMA